MSNNEQLENFIYFGITWKFQEKIIRPPFFLAFSTSRMPRDCRRRRNRTFFFLWKSSCRVLLELANDHVTWSTPRRYRSLISQFINRMENSVTPLLKVRSDRIFKQGQMTVSRNPASVRKVAILIYFRRWNKSCALFHAYITFVLVITHDAVKLYDTPHFRKILCNHLHVYLAFGWVRSIELCVQRHLQFKK